MVSLGIDVGFSAEVASTGICVNSTEHRHPVRCVHVTTNDTISAIRDLLGSERPSSISIDGPLVPHSSPNRYQVINRYRECERNLSGGIFQKRCKPGPTKCPRGQALHKQATMLANVLAGRFPKARIAEAFPNAFLGVMMSNSVFSTPIRRGIKSDVFWDHALRQKILRRLVGFLYGSRAVQLSRHWTPLQDHDERAAFICALTARAFELRASVGVLGNGDGEISLPPQTFIQPWAREGLTQRQADCPLNTSAACSTER